VSQTWSQIVDRLKIKQDTTDDIIDATPKGYRQREQQPAAAPSLVATQKIVLPGKPEGGEQNNNRAHNPFRDEKLFVHPSSASGRTGEQLESLKIVRSC